MSRTVQQVVDKGARIADRLSAQRHNYPRATSYPVTNREAEDLIVALRLLVAMAKNPS